MFRGLSGVILLVIALSLTSAAMAAPAAKHPPHKRHTTNHSVPGYGFLPGVRTPRSPVHSTAGRELSEPMWSSLLPRPIAPIVHGCIFV